MKVGHTKSSKWALKLILFDAKVTRDMDTSICMKPQRKHGARHWGVNDVHLVIGEWRRNNSIKFEKGRKSILNFATR